VVNCAREEWNIAEPDLAELFARSVASGASRSIMSQGNGTGG